MLQNLWGRLILLIIIWLGISVLTFFIQKTEIIFDKELDVKSITYIFVNNFFVFCILFFGYEFCGFTTVLISISNSFFIGAKVIPSLLFFYPIYPKIIIFASFEIFAYLIASYVGFSNGKGNKKWFMFTIGIFCLLISACYERNTLMVLNNILYENL